MTVEETKTIDNVLVKEIEAFLRLTASRNMFSAEEIQDFLLDLRTLAGTPALN